MQLTSTLLSGGRREEKRRRRGHCVRVYVGGGRRGGSGVEFLRVLARARRDHIYAR